MGTNHTRRHQFAEVLFHFTIEKYCVSTKNHFQHPISFCQHFIPNSPSTDWHSSMVNMRKDVYDWLLIPALSSWYTDINKDGNTECLGFCQKNCMRCYAFSLSLSPGRKFYTALCTTTYFKGYAGQKGGLKFSCHEPGEKCVPQLPFSVISGKHLIHAKLKVNRSMVQKSARRTLLTNCQFRKALWK